METYCAAARSLGNCARWDSVTHQILSGRPILFFHRQALRVARTILVRRASRCRDVF
jgi:hypothetical protein